ncbi:hypothetical protein, partial [Pseudomonas viridiflava]|uniref:hypothetical protein n=1 Tax=Pseudomonas viridiflava TaxID=33069 RepID=UPI0019D1BC31
AGVPMHIEIVAARTQLEMERLKGIFTSMCCDTNYWDTTGLGSHSFESLTRCSQAGSINQNSRSVVTFSTIRGPMAALSMRPG